MSGTERSCAYCARGLGDRRSYEVRGEGQPVRKCLRCSLLHPPLLKRSARIALVVGSFLVLLNQGDKIFGSTSMPNDLWWKILLTFIVPFCVATYGALSNAQRAPGQ